ncbi:mannose-1-phosphate guanylyltransferase/mannose-6-phosphate isomerase [Acidihalobacter aeolianus]|uniref:mannose-1-phosphate guanylyltransferase n=1 Tax=Acidihalobacter aeolianus TaxID=2792603 RepID=A0A1D8K947_9GAMM|nr:mannose-1-phosphate guanylyltransferase/mannose-6-phosphate isomerase [Acidihalobacter aeolianus]AOV17476.1 mannose-1-phosphate guanylyltransferase/mannose-6-phosphate isomerase [Acidihalobacter aeolianus]
MSEVVSVVLSGGSGSRLWPLSRKSHPKPYIPLPDGETLIQKTLSRVLKARPKDTVLTVTNREYYFLTRDSFNAYGKTHPDDAAPFRYLLEPSGRNTAPAMACAALWAQQTCGADTVLLFMPADHIVPEIDAFAEATRKAVEMAQKGELVTFGVQPTAPETGFGYIQIGTALPPGFRVSRFVEKPDEATAQAYVDSGEYLWNSGIFCMRADALLQAMQTHAPEVLAAAQAAWDEAREFGDAWELGGSFAQAPDISIDYAIMEKATDVAVIPSEFSWNDLGAWGAYAQLLEPDADGNRLLAPESLVEDTHNCIVHSPHRLTALLGVEDLLVADTPDALLIADKSRDQEVRVLVDALKARRHQSYDINPTMHRPWGTYTVLEEGDRFKMKRIVVKPGEKLSLQMHHHRSEHWIVVSGTALVHVGGTEKLVMTNESTFIPAGTAHRLSNPGVIDLVLIEVQSGAYLGEDDIVRFDDVYGRVEQGSPAA